MRRPTFVMVFLIAMAMLVPAAAQPSISKIELIVPTTGSHMNSFAEIVADNMRRLKSTTVVIKSMNPDTFRKAVGNYFAKTDGSQLALISTGTVLAAPSMVRMLEPVAILGHMNLALFASSSKRIHKLEDYKKLGTASLKIGAPSIGTKWAARTALGKHRRIRILHPKTTIQ